MPDNTKKLEPFRDLHSAELAPTLQFAVTAKAKDSGLDRNDCYTGEGAQDNALEGRGPALIELVRR